MIDVVDRVPTLPNRFKLTDSNGNVSYVTMERADEPTTNGTPINKALFDSIKGDINTLDTKQTTNYSALLTYLNNMITVTKSEEDVPQNTDTIWIFPD